MRRSLAAIAGTGHTATERHHFSRTGACARPGRMASSTVRRAIMCSPIAGRVNLSRPYRGDHVILLAPRCPAGCRDITAIGMSGTNLNRASSGLFFDRLAGRTRLPTPAAHADRTWMPATTTPIDDRRSRLERILALARLSLAVLAALVLRIDPLAVVTALPALPSLIMAYTLYSWAAAVAVAVVNRDSSRSASSCNASTSAGPCSSPASPRVPPTPSSSSSSSSSLAPRTGGASRKVSRPGRDGGAAARSVLTGIRRIPHAARGRPLGARGGAIRVCGRTRDPDWLSGRRTASRAGAVRGGRPCVGGGQSRRRSAGQHRCHAPRAHGHVSGSSGTTSL